MGAFKSVLQWIEGTEDKYDFANNWSTAYMAALKRPLLWIEDIADRNDLVNNW